MKEKMTRFMQGRYGIDKRGQFELLLSVVLLCLSGLLHISLCYGLALIVLIDMYVRMLSKDIEYRYAQNVKFMKYFNGFTRLFKPNHNRKTAKVKNDPTFKIYKCPDCKQKVRVPKGRGRVEITCPKCQKLFTKRS